MAKQLVKISNEGSAIRIKGQELKESLKKYNEGYSELNGGAWKVAEAVHAMLTEKQWDKDFDSERKFIEAVGANQSTWNQCKTAVTFRDENPSITKGLNVNRVYILSGMGEEAPAMLTWAKDNGIEVNSDKKLKEAIKDYKNRDAMDADYTAEDVEPEPQEETAKESEGLSDNDIVRVTYKKVNYDIPWKVLKKYEAKDKE